MRSRFFYCWILVLWGHRSAAASVTAASLQTSTTAHTKRVPDAKNDTPEERAMMRQRCRSLFPRTSLFNLCFTMPLGFINLPFHSHLSYFYKTQPECQQLNSSAGSINCITVWICLTPTSSNNRPMRGHRRLCWRLALWACAFYSVGPVFVFVCFLS